MIVFIRFWQHSFKCFVTEFKCCQLYEMVLFYMQNELHNTSPRKRQRCPFLYFQPESAILELKKWSYKPCSKQQMCSHPCFLPESAIFWTENICEIMHVCPNIRFKQSLWCERRNILALVEVFLPYRDSIYRFAVLWKIQILNIFLVIWEYW